MVKLLIRSSLFLLFLTPTFASTLHLALSSEPARLNPILGKTSVESKVTSFLFDGLVEYDKMGKVVPKLAKSYHFENNTTLIFNLRKDVLWSDGEAFDAHDVLFTYDAIMSKKSDTAEIKASFAEVKRLYAKDAHTVVVEYTKPYFQALTIWMQSIIPEHILSQSEDINKDSFNKHPIGTGLYKLERIKASGDIELIANAQHFQGAPTIQKIHLHYTPDSSSAFMMLRLNELDIASLTPLQVDRQLQPSFHQDFQLFERLSSGYTYLGFNLKEKKFQDLRVRQAIDLALDKQELLDILFFSHAKICTGPFMPKSFAFNEEVAPSKQNIAKAKALLHEAGFSPNHPLEFTITTNVNNDLRVNAVEIMQYQLAKVGIRVKIRVMEWNAFINTVVRPKNFEAVVLGWGLGLMPDAYPIWHSKGGFNFVNYHNKEVDQLIEEAKSTINQEALAKIYQRIFALIAKDLPYIFLYIPHAIEAVSRHVENVSNSIIGLEHNQKDWSIKLE